MRIMPNVYSRNSTRISNRLRKEDKSNEQFERMIAQLDLMDLIALKLEMSARVVKGKLYGVPFLKILPKICERAAIEYAFEQSDRACEGALMLSIPPKRYRRLTDKYGLYYNAHKRTGKSRRDPR